MHMCRGLAQARTFHTLLIMPWRMFPEAAPASGMNKEDIDVELLRERWHHAQFCMQSARDTLEFVGIASIFLLFLHGMVKHLSLPPKRCHFIIDNL